MTPNFRIWLPLSIVATLILSSVETAVHLAAPDSPPAPLKRARTTHAPPEPTPARSRPGPARGRVGTQLGPEVPEDAWIEADVGAPGTGTWRIFLARSSADDAVLLEFDGDRVRAVARTGGVDSPLGEAAVGGIAEAELDEPVDEGGILLE